MTNVKLFAYGDRNTRMIDNIKENYMKERVSSEILTFRECWGYAMNVELFACADKIRE